MKQVSIFILTIFAFNASKAQTASDALRYSNISLNGSTARTMSIGGSIGALGGDFSTVNTNPAGLASYRSGELIVTPGYTTNSAVSTFKSDPANPVYTQNADKFTIANIGLVFASKPYEGSNWKTSNFAIGYNRLAEFDQNVYYAGKSPGSITNRFTQQANSQDLDAYESDLAFQTGNIYKNAKGVYTSDFDLAPTTTPVKKMQTINTTGSISELVFAYGANYDEKILFGATLGVPFISYNENKTYKETPTNTAIPAFNALQYDENLSTTATGINLKLGIIAKLNKAVRIGLAVHTPTLYSSHDEYTTSLNYQYTDNTGAQNLTANSPDGTFNYKLSTPWRTILSAGFIFGRSGFLSAEAERIDYSKANFTYSGDSTQDAQAAVNADIAAKYKAAYNFKIGAEYAFENLRFRAGVSLSGSPILDKDFYNTAYSLGFCYRGQTAFFDLAYRFAQTSETYIPYLLSPATQSQQQNIAIKNNNNVFLATLGFKF